MLWTNIASVGWCSFPVTGFWFYLAFTGHERLSKNRILVAGCILLALGFIYLQWSGQLINDIIRQPYGWSVVWASSPLPLFFAAYYVILIATCIYLSFTCARRAKNLREKKQARILYISAIIPLILSSATDVILPELGITVVPAVGNVIILAWAAGLVYAMTRYGLMTLTPAAAAEDILTTMGESLMLVSPDGRIITANREALRLLGYAKKELIGKEFSSIAVSADSKIGTSPELVYLTKSGNAIPVLLSVSAVKDKAGEPLGLAVVARDITVRKKMEQDLRESERKYRELVENMSEGLVAIDEKNIITFVNRKFCQLLGYKFEEIVGKHIFDLYDSENLEILKRELAKRPKGIPSQYEIIWTAKSGRQIPTFMSGVPIFDAEGLYRGAYTTITDFSEHKQTEEKLKESEEKYRLLFHTSPDAIAQADAEGRFITANLAMAKSLGVPLGELAGKRFSEVMPQQIAEQRLQLGRRAINEKRTIFFEDERGGRYFQNIVAPVEIYGQEDTFQVIARDVTERKKIELKLRESEERYRTLVDHALVGIGIDQNDRIVFANKELANMLGYTLEEIIGSSIVDRIHPDDRAFVLARAQRRQTEFATEPETYEARLLKKDGGTIYALISNVVIEYNGEKAILMTIADVTDTKLRKGLEQVNKELEAFSYSVSHDLRAPLRTIDGFSRALLEDYGDKLEPQGKDYLGRIRAASQHMSELIDDLLNLSRITRAEMRYEKVNLSALAEVVAAELHEAQPERLVEFVIGENITAYGDSHLLQVVLENLLSNAWKFTSKHPRARIEFGSTQDQGRPVYFVRDDGVGFDMAYVDKLFSPFQRLHSEREFPGTGIGLATVQRIIRRHGGNIWAEAEVEKGATFYFTLQS